MKIFEKDGWIHLQLMNLTLGKMIFDFKVPKEDFNELRDHIVEHLLAFKMSEENDKVEEYLVELAESLEPKTHCCECTPGVNQDLPHFVHIQYIDCLCKEEDYILKRNK